MTQPMTIDDYELHTAQVLYRILALARLTPTQSDVWNSMLFSITDGTRVNVSQKEIADFLKVDTAYISRATRRLKELGLIWRPPGSGFTWHVNVRLAYKGPTDEWISRINQADDDQVPQVDVPAYTVRPPRRSDSRLRSVSA